MLQGQREMLDVDLAALYDVSTGCFNEQVRRNHERFPTDSTFQMTNQGLAIMIYVVRALARVREVIAQNKEIAKKLDAPERRIDSHDETIVELPEGNPQAFGSDGGPTTRTEASAHRLRCAQGQAIVGADVTTRGRIGRIVSAWPV